MGGSMKNIKTNALANFLVRFANVVVPVLTGTYINRVFQNSVEYNLFRGLLFWCPANK